MEEETIKLISSKEIDVLGFDPSKLRQSNIDEILQMSVEQWEALDSHSCESYSFKILLHCMYVQSKLNKVRALKDKLSNDLRMAVSKEINNYSGISWTYAESKAIDADHNLRSLNNRITELDRYLTIGYGIVKILQDMSKKIEGFKYGKNT